MVTYEDISEMFLNAVEETGLSVHIVERLGDITYWFSARGVRHHKTVHFYLLEATGGRMEDHDWENDFVEWISEHEVVERMSFASELEIVQLAISRARAHLKARQSETSVPQVDVH